MTTTEQRAAAVEQAEPCRHGALGRCLTCEAVSLEDLAAARLRRAEALAGGLCQCRLPECGECTEQVDKGLRNERMPRRPR